MRVEVYNRESHRDLWEGFVGSRARNAHFMHSRDYLEYHEDRFVDHSLLLFDGKKVAGVLPANRNDSVLVSHGGLSFGGLLVSDKFRLKQWMEAFVAIGEHMREAGLTELDYRATPIWQHDVPGEEDVYLIESAGAQPEGLASAICRMDGEFLGNATRRNEARCDVVVDRDETARGELMDLIAETLQRRHETAPVHTREEMDTLAGRFPDGIRCYTARAGEELVGGVVLFCTAAAVKLQYVGYSDSQAMSAIYAHLFGLEEFTGRWFDFGTSMAGGVIDPGLFAYKESLGGRLASLRRYKLAIDSPLLNQC